MAQHAKWLVFLRKKYGIDFADAGIALQDENALTIEDAFHDELRCRTLSLVSDPGAWPVAHAERDEETIRIIAARKADCSGPRSIARD